MEKIPKWDLNEFFASIDDPKINESLEATLAEAKSFRAKYFGKLAEISQPIELKRVLEEYETILSHAVLPEAYASLVFSTNTILPANGAFLQKVMSRTVEINSELIFFELELITLADEKFEAFVNSEELANYKHYLKKQHIWKKHRLGEKEEQLMDIKSLTGAQALQRLFEQELSRLKFSVTIDGKEKEVSEDEALSLLRTARKQQEREEIAKRFTQTLLTKESVLTFVFNMLAEDKKNNDKLRSFDYPEQARHMANEATPEAVETLARVVEKNYDLVQEYYEFKKSVLELEKLYDWDRYAPIEAKAKKYTFQEAKEIVLTAFENFDPKFGQLAKDFFDGKRIDAEIVPGKRGGAYCQGSTPAVHAYVFMNFTGSANDVMTLAHELGHGINDELARMQTIVNYYNPLTLAETASTFAETLVFNELIKREQDPQILFALYIHKIEGIIASVQRQISMYRFEQDFHNAYRAGGELPQEKINELWRRRQTEMFGDSVELSADYDKWWMYIPHFVNTPFYVYAYAFGELLALGLFEQFQENPKQFPITYTKFMQNGGSKAPDEVAAMFGVNFNDESFWENGILIVRNYLSKAKALYQKKQA